LGRQHQQHPEEHQQSEEGSEEGGMGNALRLVSKKDAQNSTMLASFRGSSHKVLSTPPFVLVWGTLSQTGWSGEDPQYRKLSGGKFPRRLTTVGD
jgi:hypothetical protein